jgi:2-(1,2-epoxy-1,2-dihydrophenyl)acetyl-CoA isomerase
METGNFKGFAIQVQDPGIAIVEFNTPERLNGLNQAVKRDLIESLTQAQMDDGIRVILFTGQGRAFCAGDDISGRTADFGETKPLVPDIPHGHNHALGTYDGLRWLSQAVNTSIRAIDKISIAALNGVAVQTGLSLALSCDFRIASEAARLMSGTLRFGLLPDEGGQYLLVQHMGVAKTMDFLMLNRMIEADEALELGLVHEVVPADQLMDRSLALATELANGPQMAMRFLKRSIYNAHEMSWEQSLDEIAAKTAVTDHLSDAREGASSFRDKRRAKFNQDSPARTE